MFDNQAVASQTVEALKTLDMSAVVRLPNHEAKINRDSLIEMCGMKKVFGTSHGKLFGGAWLVFAWWTQIGQASNSALGDADRILMQIRHAMRVGKAMMPKEMFLIVGEMLDDIFIIRRSEHQVGEGTSAGAAALEESRC
jgi:hypothetical protein